MPPRTCTAQSNTRKGTVPLDSFAIMLLIAHQILEKIDRRGATLAAMVPVWFQACLDRNVRCDEEKVARQGLHALSGFAACRTTNPVTQPSLQASSPLRSDPAHFCETPRGGG